MTLNVRRASWRWPIRRRARADLLNEGALKGGLGVGGAGDRCGWTVAGRRVRRTRLVEAIGDGAVLFLHWIGDAARAVAVGQNAGTWRRRSGRWRQRQLSLVQWLIQSWGHCGRIGAYAGCSSWVLVA